METTATTAASDRPFHIETYGIAAIPEAERHGTARELFYIWFTANMAMVSLVFGAILALYGLNLWQSLFVLVVGTAGSFALVGVLSLAGTWGHMPMLALSGASFGKNGNAVPALVSWLSLVGWEIVGAVLATYGLLGLLNLAGLPATALWIAVSLGITATMVVLAGIFGHATIVAVQHWITLSFGVLTLVLCTFLAVDTNWSAVFSAAAGPWDTGVLAALSIIGAGTGVTWLSAGADYTRYLPGGTRARAIIGWTTGGALLPILVVALVGFLLAGRVPNLASAANPISAVGSVLPAWLLVPYLLTAIVGLLAGAIDTIYSSGLSLLAAGIRLPRFQFVLRDEARGRRIPYSLSWVRPPRYQSVLIDGALMLVGATYTLFFARSFVGTFESYLQVAAVALTAWAAIFLVDMLRWRGVYPEEGTAPRWGVHWSAVVAWLVGLVLGLLSTVSPLFTGPLARGLLATGSFGYVFSFAASLVVYAALLRVLRGTLAAEQARERVRTGG